MIKVWFPINSSARSRQTATPIGNSCNYIYDLVESDLIPTVFVLGSKRQLTYSNNIEQELIAKKDIGVIIARFSKKCWKKYWIFFRTLFQSTMDQV